MKKIKTSKKLNLNKQAISVLEESNLNNINGGRRQSQEKLCPSQRTKFNTVCRCE